MSPRVISLGVVILDVLGRPCLDLPPGQVGQRIDQIRLTAAGTAAGFAVDLAKLDQDVALVGCIGSDDIGALLVTLLERHGVDTSLLTRTTVAQTSASMLPIRPDGERPAYHTPGANTQFRLDTEMLQNALSGVAHLHVGGPDSMGSFIDKDMAAALSLGRGAGATTSVDLLSARLNGSTRTALRSAMPLIDYFMPNDQQICELYETANVAAACDAALDDGARAVVVTLGVDGCLIATPAGHMRVPTSSVDVVDTTGCGDAFSAGFIRGKLLGWSDEAAAKLACTAGSLVATGLGSDAGIVDLQSTIAAVPAASSP